MVQTRTKVAAALAVVAGVLTLRTVRQRRAAQEAQEDDPVVELRTEAGEASGHASAALSHARAAAEHGVEYARQEFEESRPRESAEETEQTRLQPISRFR